VPLVQGSLRYAYKIGEVPGDRSQKNAAEGAVFTAAVLPLVAQCNPTAAETISSNMKFGLYDAGTFPSFTAVKAAFESTYSCLGITCAQVGGLVDSGGSLLSSKTAPCIRSSPLTSLPSIGVESNVETETVYHATGSMVAAGEIASFNDEKKNHVATAIANELNVPTSRIVVEVVPASVIIEFRVEYSEKAAADVAVNNLMSSIDTPERATTFFSAAAITVTSAPTIITRSQIRAVSGGNSLPGWGAAIIAITAVLSTLLLALTVLMYTREKAGKPIFLALSPVAVTKTSTKEAATAESNV